MTPDKYNQYTKTYESDLATSHGKLNDSLIQLTLVFDENHLCTDEELYNQLISHFEMALENKKELLVHIKVSPTFFSVKNDVFKRFSVWFIQQCLDNLSFLTQTLNISQIDGSEITEIQDIQKYIVQTLSPNYSFEKIRMCIQKYFCPIMAHATILQRIPHALYNHADSYLQYQARFHSWYLQELEKLSFEGVIDNIHIADMFKWDTNTRKDESRLQKE